MMCRHVVSDVWKFIEGYADVRDLRRGISEIMGK